MTVRLSTGLANAMASGGAAPAYAPQTSGVLVVGTKYRIHTFVAGDSFTNVGAASNATGVDFVATGTTPTTWTNSSILTPIGSTGGVAGSLNNGFINIYSGPQPVTADTGATGTLLATVSTNGDGTTGLIFGAAADGVIAKAASDWEYTGLAVGTAGWFRFYPPSGNPSALSTTEARLDGAIATSGSDMDLSNISIAVAAPGAIVTFSYQQPKS